MPVPDLTDHVLFPPFMELPEDDGEAQTLQSNNSHYLIAQIKDNMTITKPTLVLTDRTGHPFALVFDGLDRDGLDLAKLGLKKGATVVIRGARRNVPAPAPGGQDVPETLTSKAAKRPFLRIAPSQANTVQAVPAALDQVVAAAGKIRQRKQSGAEAEERRCDACGGSGPTTASTTAAATTSPAQKLLKCTACGQAWYCNQECQRKGWNDGHKTECKALRGLKAIWGE